MNVRILQRTGEVETLLLGRATKDHHYGEVRWRKILRRDPCVFCGNKYKDKASKKLRREGVCVPEQMTLEHIVPRSKEKGWTNLAASCYACNQAKGDSSLLDFLIERVTDVQISSGV